MRATKMRIIFLLDSKTKHLIIGFKNSIVQRRKLCEETNHLKECLQMMNQTLDKVNYENASLKQMEEAKDAAAMYSSVYFLQKY